MTSFSEQGLGSFLLSALPEPCNTPFASLSGLPLSSPLIGTADPYAIAVFQQLGIEDQYKPISKLFSIAKGVKGCRYSRYIICRPLLYDLILRLIPPTKILSKKRVPTIAEEDVRIQTADNSVI
ncbi:MAG: hypothetical protein J3R72DRAFT_497984 [Linnemannia gamsii]|nr:MAG: hypothetical protein J3R72DRAFT_497984 [Linnemannia gamsii]